MSESLNLLYKIISDVFQIDIDSIDEDTSQDTVSSWDSMGMVNLVNELESRFKVEFGLLEIADLRTVGIIKSMLEGKGISFQECR